MLNWAARSFAFANGTSPAVIDFGGHTFSNDTVTTAGVFKQTGTGALALLNGELNPAKALLLGKVRVRGNKGLLLKLIALA